MAMNIRLAVKGSCSKKILDTGRSENTSVPKSPCITLRKKVPSCTTKGLSRPSFWARSARISGVARGPRTILRGSPGTAWIIPYSRETAITTISAANPSRLAK